MDSAQLQSGLRKHLEHRKLHQQLVTFNFGEYGTGAIQYTNQPVGSALLQNEQLWNDVHGAFKTGKPKVKVVKEDCNTCTLIKYTHTYTHVRAYTYSHTCAYTYAAWTLGI